jgi:hypothetical protein
VRHPFTASKGLHAVHPYTNNPYVKGSRFEVLSNSSSRGPTQNAHFLHSQVPNHSTIYHVQVSYALSAITCAAFTYFRRRPMSCAQLLPCLAPASGADVELIISHKVLNPQEREVSLPGTPDLSVLVGICPSIFSWVDRWNGFLPPHSVF